VNGLSEAEAPDEAVADMVSWLTMMLRPVDWNNVDPEMYRHTDDDELELGGRVADELLSEWAYRSGDGMRVVLDQRIAQAADRAGQAPRPAPTAAAQPEPLPADAGNTVWSVPAYAPYVMPMSLLCAITAWMRTNGVQDASGHHAINVQAHADGVLTAVYQRGRPTLTFETPDHTVTETSVLVVTDPPALPVFPDLTALGAVIDKHPVGVAHFNTPLPIGSQVCITCTQATGPYTPAVYPCPAVVDAATAAGVEVYPDDLNDEVTDFEDEQELGNPVCSPSRVRPRAAPRRHLRGT